MRTSLLISTAIATIILGSAVDAEAVPSFARRYGTSCQTCHVAFPKLNSFGEAFRANGYRFPAGEEEDASEDDPVRLGQDALKKVFPNAVWPGRSPGQIPLAATMASTMRFTDHGDPKVSFDDVGSSLGLTFASSVDDAFSVWAGARIAGQGDRFEAELERVFVVVKPFDEPKANLRVGRFEPRFGAVTVHRNLGFAPLFLTTQVDDNEFTLDPDQLGLEVFGVVGGRLSYSAGLVEGAGNLPNNAKDGYARLSYKVGGMRPDGIGGATDAQPWRETSIQVGSFGYVGQATLGNDTASQRDRFGLAGADLDIHWKDLNLIGSVAYQRNSRPSLADPEDEGKVFHVFSQADYVVYPWLVPTLRYEHRNQNSSKTRRISGGVYVLLRANVRAQLLGAAQFFGTDYDSTQGALGLNLAL